MTRKAVLLILVLVLLASAVGCGLAAPALPAMGVGGGDETSRELAPAALPPAEAPSAVEGGETLATASQDTVGDRMIVRTGSLAIVVKDTEETLKAIERLASELGGYVSDLQSWRQDDQMAATVTVRVLAESFDQARERVKELAIEVESENASGQDVTEEYVDLDARLSNLEAAEQELRELLASAQETHKDAESILAIYNEITNIRTQIEQIKGRMKYLENTSKLATLTITVTPEKPVVEPGWEPLRQAREALRTLVNALKGLVNILIWVILFFLPLAAVLALPLILIWLVWYLRRRRRRRTKAA
jgi:hypothetical protein